MAFSKTEAFDLLRRAHSNGRLAHAYLITGPVGAGKRDLAAQLAGLVTGSPAAESFAFDLPPPAADIFKHPDVHTAGPESKSRRIVIEQVRELEKELQMRASLGGKKAGIIFEADRLQIQAANAF
jgi:DNA polymerase-3 subunit delta'